MADAAAPPRLQSEGEEKNTITSHTELYVATLDSIYTFTTTPVAIYVKDPYTDTVLEEGSMTYIFTVGSI